MEDYLDIHNGRTCVTPEYPGGTYAYFATVDANWNSAYPYVVGPTFYGISANRKVTTVTESTTIYTPGATGVSETEFNNMNVNIFPNPASDLIGIQLSGLVKDDMQVELFDLSGKLIKASTINKGSTISYFDVQSLYAGAYLVKVSANGFTTTRKVIITRN